MRLPAAISMILLIAGCAPDERPAAEQAPPQSLVWPQPPERARIEFLYAFDEPRDLGIRPGFFKRLWSIIAGAENQRMLRPYAVAVDGPFLAIADPGLPALHLIDRDAKEYRKVQKLGAVSLASPVGVAIAGDRVYVSDSALGQVFAIARDGTPLATIDGLQRPTGLAIDPDTGNLYVAETLAHRVSIFDSRGQRIDAFGSRGTAAGQFNYPTHLSVSGDRLLVNDTMNFRMQTFDLDGGFRSAFGRHGDGSGDFAQSKGVGTDPEGHVYVVDALFNRVQIFDSQGRFLLAFGGDGTAAGDFWLPAGLYIAGDRIFVADSYNRRIQVFQFLGGG